MRQRRKVPPAIARPAIPEAHDLRVRRGKVLGEINQAQWEFDRTPTVKNANRLRELRDAVSELELMIAEISEDKVIRDQVLRSMLTMEGLIGDTTECGSGN